MTPTTAPTPPVAPAAPTGAPTSPHRTTALVAGAFYLVTFLASIPAVLYFLTPVLTDPGYVVGAGADTRVVWGCVLDVVNALACIGTAVALYPSSGGRTRPSRWGSSPPAWSRPPSS